MGNKPSTHIYLHEWTNPVIKVQTKQIPIRLVLTGLESADTVALKIVNDSNLRQRLFYDQVLPANQRAIILRVNCTYIHNEFPKDIKLEMRGMFDVPATNEELTHPDNTGSLVVFCPASISWKLTGIDQQLYRPRSLLDETIKAYAGLEDAILKSRTHPFPSLYANPDVGVQVPNVEVFDESDPLMEFVITRSEALNVLRDDVLIMEEGDGKRYYQVRGEFLQQVREVFRDTVFDEFRYDSPLATKLISHLNPLGAL